MSNIVYYVDVGYSSKYPYSLKSLDDIIFTDFKRPLVIPVISNFNFTQDELIGTTSDVDIQTRFYDTARLMLGNFVDSIYASPLNNSFFYTKLGYGDEESYNTLVGAFPSLLLGYPNIIEQIKHPTDRGTLESIAIRFNSLNKIYVIEASSYNGSGSWYRGIYSNNPFSELYSEYASGFNTPAEFCFKKSQTSFAYDRSTRIFGIKDLTKSITSENNCFTVDLVANFSNPLGVGNRNVYVKPRILTYPKNSFWTYLFGDVPLNPDTELPDNPYEPGGPSGPTDPTLPPGTFDDDSDPIPDSPLPTLSAANTGFTRIYNPTLSQVQALARYLWTDPDVIQTIWNHIKQFFENPMEAIIGFNLVPVPVPNGGTENFALMYIDTGVQMTVAANQFVDLDCGTLELKRYYGSALDQSPYTKVSCFLPYIGTVNLNTDEVMGTTLQVKYRVDIVSGSCVAKIFVDGNCLYQYSGHCAITIPISSADFSSYVSAAISVGKLAAAAMTAGAGAAMAAGVGEVAQQTNQVVTTTQTTNTMRNPVTGRQITTGTTTTVQTRESPSDQSSTQASFSGLSPQNAANTVGAIMSSKPHIEHSGSFSGNSGYLGIRRPFVIIERPNMCMPANYQALNGFPSMITMELGTCKGFTRVQQVQLTGLHATNPEQAEILELLKSGVIL